jgi:hypothetical protein
MSTERDIKWRVSLYLDFFLQLSFEAGPDNLSLTGLETVRNGRDRADVVSHGEKDQLFVDEIRVRNLVRVVVEIRARLQKSVNQMMRMSNVEDYTP